MNVEQELDAILGTLGLDRADVDGDALDALRARIDPNPLAPFRRRATLADQARASGDMNALLRARTGRPVNEIEERNNENT